MLRVISFFICGSQFGSGASCMSRVRCFLTFVRSWGQNGPRVSISSSGHGPGTIRACSEHHPGTFGASSGHVPDIARACSGHHPVMFQAESLQPKLLRPSPLQPNPLQQNPVQARMEMKGDGRCPKCLNSAPWHWPRTERRGVTGGRAGHWHTFPTQPR